MWFVLINPYPRLDLQMSNRPYSVKEMFLDFAHKIMLVIFLFKVTKLYRVGKIMFDWEIEGREKVKKGYFILTIAKT